MGFYFLFFIFILLSWFIIYKIGVFVGTEKKEDDLIDSFYEVDKDDK